MYEVRIIFGHRGRDGQRLPAALVKQAQHIVLNIFAQAFGGAQVYVCQRLGGYVPMNGTLVTEPATLVFAYAERVDASLELLQRTAERIAELLDQETVLLAAFRLDGMFALVRPIPQAQLVTPAA